MAPRSTSRKSTLHASPSSRERVRTAPHTPVCAGEVTLSTAPVVNTVKTHDATSALPERCDTNCWHHSVRAAGAS